MTSNRACISCPPVYLPPSRSKKETFTRIQKRKVLRQARFFRWLRFHHGPVPVPVFPAGSREKRDTATALGVYRPLRQRFPVGNRVTLVVLGFSAPPRLAAVWWISLPSLHLCFRGNLLLAYPPFLISKIVRHIAVLVSMWPDVARGEEPPCICDLVSYGLKHG